ncbi:glycosyl hydrolase, BNR repeat-containing protein (plasmid) [Leptolyngbya sp. NIES-3755]|nr:glycosyl hydrolase, BNR repeat-containing protein [Leptolyngbya sp. NIES-3755]
MKEPQSNRSMKWMGIAMIACCAIPIAGALFLGGGLGVLFGRSTQPIPNSATPQARITAVNSAVTLEPANNWRENNHVHGLSVDSQNPQIIYVATHNGLLKRTETGEWFWVGKQRADYMGFTADPTNPNRFYASGHPPTGGNLGFQISENQGESWTPVSLPGVDFHAMTIAPSSPTVFYGFPASGAEGLHLSRDGGKTWTKPRMAGLTAMPFDLVVDPNNSEHVYATTRTGVYESSNAGDDWVLIPSTQTAPILGLTLQKNDNDVTMIGYRFLQSAPGLYQSQDNGKSWEKLWTDTQGVIVKIAAVPRNPKMLYAVNENNTVFQSQDGGRTWAALS